MIQQNFWQIRDSSIINPESTYYDPETNLIFVSNVVGDESTKDGQGWISKISVDGQLIEAKWVEGLNAPHGMRTYQGTLWVADIGELVEIDLESGDILSKIPIPGSAFLNDVAIADDGRIFVSDTLTNNIYLVSEDEVTVFASGEQLESPNGLLIKENKLFVTGWGNIIDPTTFETNVLGNVFEIDLNSKQKRIITQFPLGNLDGIEQDLDGNFLVSDYTGGKLFVVNQNNGEVDELISDLDGSADIGFIPDDNLILVPSLSQSTVTAYQYKPTISLSEDNPKLLELNGDIAQANLQFLLSDKNIDRSSIDEIGVFGVDDSQGRIDGLLPDEDGYLEIALNRSQTIFSVLPDDFAVNYHRILDSFTNQFLSFYLVQNGTTDEVLANPSSQDRVLLGTSINNNVNTLQISTENNQQFQLSFEDGLGDGERDVSITVDLTTDSAPIGTKLQGQSQGELVDLRDFTGEKLRITFPIIDSEAAYDNTFGFYQIEDEEGRVIDPLTSIEFRPGDEGYIQAALRNSQQLGVSLTENNDNPTGILSGGHLYAPFLIANNSLENKLASLETNIDDDTFVYFSELEANADAVDHLRLLGDNTWGFEDLAFGGDRDFNDFVVQAEFSLIF
jgi:hypothetical protein